MVKPQVFANPKDTREREHNKWVSTVWNVYCGPGEQVNVGLPNQGANQTGNYFEMIFTGNFDNPDNAGVDQFEDFDN